MKSVILHVDMDAFFAAVEQRDRPELKGLPVVVGAPPDQRGVVAAASYEARKFGIRSAMPSREAGRLCPHAVFVPPNMRRYSEVSRQVMTILDRFTPLVEPLSIDEAFLDVTGSQRLFGDGVEIARRIREEIRSETGLTASVGVASNKFLAKLASDLNKPDGLTLVPESRSEILAFLAPMPVRRLWGVGKVTQQVLAQQGIETIGQIQAITENRLAEIVGKHSAWHLYRLAFGEDGREIELESEEKSLSREHTFLEDCTSPDMVRQVLGRLADDVGRRLRALNRYATVAHLKLRGRDFKTLTRQRALPTPCCDDFAFRSMAEELFLEQKWTQPVRLIGFGVSGLTEQPEQQLELFAMDAEERKRRERLSRTVDGIRDRLGERSIRRAGTLAEDEENGGDES